MSQGLPVRRVTSRVAAGFVQLRKQSTHKGDAGRVYILAGSRGMAGAAVLAALGAARSGAGLVRVGIVRSQQPIVARRAPVEVTSEALPEDRHGQLASNAWQTLKKSLAAFRPDVIAAGPGLGQSKAVREVVRNLVRQDSPVVLDADGLNALAKLQLKFKAAAVLTPHAGEMARLLKLSSARVNGNRQSAVESAVKKFRAVTLLKGAGTLVSDGRTIYRNTTGNSGMASGGMGDVLTGIIAATWAQMRPRDISSGARAAAFAAFVHGLAADLAAKRFPQRTLLASDVAAALPQAFQKIWRLKPHYGGRR